MVRRNGLEKVAFFTLTFAENLTCRIEAQKRFNSFATNFLRHHVTEYVAAVERQNRGALHYHLVIALPYDVRSGFDFEFCAQANAARKAGDDATFRRLQRIAFATANHALRNWWKLVRENAQSHGFGRCETLPILSNSAALCRYVGSYVSSEAANRQLRDKGLRTIRYGLKKVVHTFQYGELAGQTHKVSLRPAAIRYQWREGNGQVWRNGCACLALILNLDDFTEALGKQWAWNWRREIGAFGRHMVKVIDVVNRFVSDNSDFTQRVAIASKLGGVILQKEAELAS